MIRRKRWIKWVGVGGGAEATPWYLAGGITTSQIYGAWRATGAASQAASYVNIISPGTHDLAAGTAAPTWSASTGWTFNGSSQYLTTDLTPDGSGRYSMFIAISGWTQGYHAIAGYRSNGSRGFMVGSNGPTQLIFQNFNTVTPAGSMTQGVLGMYGKYGYANGILAATCSQDNLQDTRVLEIGRVQTDTLYYAGNVAAFILFVKNATLTDGQILALSTAMSSL